MQDTNRLCGGRLFDYLAANPGAIYSRSGEQRTVMAFATQQRLVSLTIDGEHVRVPTRDDFVRFPDDFRLVRRAPEKPVCEHRGFEVKAFEIRDSATFIPVIAIHGDPMEMSAVDHWLVGRAGWSSSDFTYLLWPGSDQATYDPMKWHGDTRTMPTAHEYIKEHWVELESGAVIDVEFILGERSEPKVSEREEEARMMSDALAKLRGGER